MSAKHSVAETVSTDFGRVESHRWGDANRTLVLLHAAATGPRALAPIAGMVAEAGWTCIAPALHGYGESRVDGAASPIDGHVEIARWAVETTAACAVFGHSMGGLTALLATLKVERLVLFEPILLAALDQEADGPLIAIEAAMYAAMQRHLTDGDREAAVRVFIETWNDAAWPDLPAGFRARLTEQAPQIVAETLATGAAAIADDVWTAAPPTALLHGDRSPEIARRMVAGAARRIDAATVAALPGIGHMGPLAVPAIVSQAVLSALAPPP